MHQHRQPIRHDRCGTRGEKGRGTGSYEEGLGQDLPVPGIESGHRVPEGFGTSAVHGGTGLPRHRIRMHDLHRQQRTSGPRDRQEDPGQWPRRRGGGVQQQELRGTHSRQRQGQLSGIPAAGRSSVDSGTHRHRHRHRTSGNRQREGRVPEGYLAHR